MGKALALVLECAAAEQREVAGMDPLRQVYIMYDHAEDQGYYDLFRDRFEPEVVSPVHRESRPLLFEEDLNATVRRLTEAVAPASVVLVLCGRNTWGLRYVDLELLVALNQRKGLVGIYLPTVARSPDGKFRLPARLRDNLKSGFASMVHWDLVFEQPVLLTSYLRLAALASKDQITTGRTLRLVNSQLPPVPVAAAGPSDRSTRSSHWLPRWWRFLRKKRDEQHVPHR
jgi:hypothetical protein